MRRFGTSATVVALAGALLVPATPEDAAAAPAPATASFAAITCPAPTTCFAAGSYGDNEHEYLQPLVARLAGNKWILSRPPTPAAPADTSRGSLSGIACATPKRCFAVGAFDTDYGASIHRRTLIEQWDGTGWSIASRLRPAGADRSALLDIECPRATSCFAVGQWEDVDHLTHVFVTRWNGTRWSIVPTPRIKGKVKQSRLLSISCTGASDCVAVGTHTRPKNLGLTLAEHWNGKRWSVVESPNPPRPMDFYDVLSSVSCAGPTRCLAVGSQQDSISEEIAYETLSLRWGNHWKIVATPKHTRYTTHYLNGVACPAIDLCLSVGTSATYDPSTYRTKKRAHVERWDGTKWSVAKVPASAPPLNGIACRSRRDCMAVGGSQQPVVARWNGATWTTTAVPVTLGPA